MLAEPQSGTDLFVLVELVVGPLVDDVTLARRPATLAAGLAAFLLRRELRSSISSLFATENKG